ncbi:NFACT RNA binding domain-containing protein [Aquirufa sp.]|jgi:predicted ribosome quality control (RQC) complex YloA/Tae2 family protein|uniref:NFACT RNA binding domain-containing protein n=1 Tax=Aquirufa sp. TaxID=2676249 RepID=UPI0037C160C6
MHNNHFFLRILARELRQILTYARLKQCFSQEKDELVIGFERQNGQDLWIKCSFGSQFSSLQFPDDFRRAGRNSVDLFSDLLLHEVQDVRVFENERAIGMYFLGEQVLVFKLFGNRSNVILFQAGEHCSQFQKRLGKDFAIQLDQLDRKLDQRFEAFQQADGDWMTLYPTLGKEGGVYLNSLGYSKQSVSGQWALLQQTMELLHEPQFTIIETEKGIALSLFPVAGEVLYQTKDVFDALNQFYSLHYSVGEFRREKSLLRETLGKLHLKAIHYLESLEKQQVNRDASLAYEEKGNILMAFLHLIPAGANAVVLDNFYQGGTVSIKLNAQLSGPENAENYYRKAKNFSKEIAQWESNVARKKAEIIELGEQLKAVEAAQVRRELKPFLQYLQVQQSTKQSAEELPFKQFITGGWTIWVGKNAKNNDLLTLKYAKKFDIWLHARDVSGSHVIIRNPQQRTVPKHVIEKAAELAAHFSKRANESLCPVIVTAKKYVRKTKDLLPGQVIVDREEEVVLVRPTYWE